MSISGASERQTKVLCLFQEQDYDGLTLDQSARNEQSISYKSLCSYKS